MYINNQPEFVHLPEEKADKVTPAKPALADITNHIEFEGGNQINQNFTGPENEPLDGKLFFTSKLPTSPRGQQEVESDSDNPRGLHAFIDENGVIHTASELLAQMSTDANEQLKQTKYIVVRDKRWGVEPGYEALEAWQEEHDARLNNPGDAYYRQIQEILLQCKKRNIPITRKLMKEQIIAYNQLRFGPELETNQYLKERMDVLIHAIDKKYLSKINFDKLNKNLQSTDLSTLMRQIVNNIPPFFRMIAKAFLHGMDGNFTKLHFIKLDYSISEMWFKVFGKVGVPMSKAKGVTAKISFQGQEYNIGKATKALHWLGTREHRSDKNWGAIREALANDLFAIRKVKGQELEVILSKYPDNYPHILLDGSEITGPNNEKFYTLEGHLYGGRIAAEDTQGKLIINHVKVNGQLYPVDKASLASMKIKTLIAGDRDKIGSNGGNIGFVIIEGKAVIYNIDPGKSYEDLEGIANTEIHTDLTFSKPTSAQEVITGGYKNYTIFDDTPLALKIQGVRDVLATHKACIKKINEYIQVFRSEDLNYKQELLAIRRSLEQEALKLRETFKERLLLSDTELNFLDNLEKLTSPTRNQVLFSKNGKERTIQLDQPEVLSGTRLEWHMEKGPEGVTLSCKVKDLTRRHHVVLLLAKRGLTPLFDNKTGKITLTLPDGYIAKQPFSFPTPKQSPLIPSAPSYSDSLEDASNLPSLSSKISFTNGKMYMISKPTPNEIKNSHDTLKTMLDAHYGPKMKERLYLKYNISENTPLTLQTYYKIATGIAANVQSEDLKYLYDRIQEGEREEFFSPNMHHSIKSCTSFDALNNDQLVALFESFQYLPSSQGTVKVLDLIDAKLSDKHDLEIQKTFTSAKNLSLDDKPDIAISEFVAKKLAYSKWQPNTLLLIPNFTGTPILYKVKEQVIHKGLVGNLFVPANAYASNEIYIAFKGTKSLIQWRRNLDYDGVGITTFNECFPEILSAINRTGNKDYNLNLTGHSLGAVDAQLTTAYLVEQTNIAENFNSINLVTHNSPRIELETNNRLKNAIAKAEKVNSPIKLEITHVRFFDQNDHEDFIQKAGTVLLGSDHDGLWVNVNGIEDREVFAHSSKVHRRILNLQITDKLGGINIIARHSFHAFNKVSNGNTDWRWRSCYDENNEQQRLTMETILAGYSWQSPETDWTSQLKNAAYRYSQVGTPVRHTTGWLADKAARMIIPTSTPQKIHFTPIEHFSAPYFKKAQDLVGRRKFSKDHQEVIQAVLKQSPKARQPLLELVDILSKEKNELLSKVSSSNNIVSSADLAAIAVKCLPKILEIKDIDIDLSSKLQQVFLVFLTTPFVNNTQIVYDSMLFGLYEYTLNNKEERTADDYVSEWNTTTGEKPFTGATTARKVNLQMRIMKDSGMTWDASRGHHIVDGWESAKYNGEVLESVDRVLTLWPEGQEEEKVEVRAHLDLSSLNFKSKDDCIKFIQLVEVLGSGANQDWIDEQKRHPDREIHTDGLRPQQKKALEKFEGNHASILRVAVDFVYALNRGFLEESLKF